MHSKTLTTLQLVIFLSACATESDPAKMSEEQLEKQQTPDLCVAYGKTRSEHIEAELVRRNLLTDEEMNLIQQKKVKTGMSTCAALAVLGAPQDINEQVSNGGDREQWVYRTCDSCEASYVYIKNGKVVRPHE